MTHSGQMKRERETTRLETARSFTKAMWDDITTSMLCTYEWIHRPTAQVGADPHGSTSPFLLTPARESTGEQTV